MKNSEFVTQWALDTVQKDYPEDIALVVAHSTLRIDEKTPTVSYFVPITQRGRNFAQTFLLDGEGFDIWGIPWERLEQFAGLEEYNVTVLADGEVLWARNEEDRQRFEALKAKQKALLSEPEKQSYLVQLSLNIAKQFYLKQQFETERSIVWTAYILDYLARAIAFHNGSYFRQSQTDQLNELRQMAEVPQGFAELYQQAICAKTTDERTTLCHRLICLVEDFLGSTAKPQKEQNFQDLADWYGELAYTWLRIRSYAEQGNVTKCYMWGIYLQTELDQVCEDFGLEKMDLMSAYDSENLSALVVRANELEQQMRSIITEKDGVIREYSRENFPGVVPHEA